MNSNGVFGTLWVSLALGSFYAALIWINSLLSMFLSPLISMTSTWLMDRKKGQKRSDSLITVQ